MHLTVNGRIHEITPKPGQRLLETLNDDLHLSGTKFGCGHGECGACEPECPVTAIFPEEDVPAAQTQYVQINRDIFKSDTPPGRPTR